MANEPRKICRLVKTRNLVAMVIVVKPEKPFHENETIELQVGPDVSIFARVLETDDRMPPAGAAFVAIKIRIGRP